MIRTNARRLQVAPTRIPSAEPATARAVKSKGKSGDGRMGFDWGGGGSDRRRNNASGHGSGGGSMGWPYSGGGTLGWPYSGGGTLGVGLGYHRDLPDWRDLSLRNPKRLKGSVVEALNAIKEQNARHAIGAAAGKKANAKSFHSALLGEVPPDAAHDLRATGSFSPVEDQGDIGSCTAQAVIGLVEYLLNEGGVRGQDMSRMFLYRVTRKLLGWTGDTGAYIRSTIKAMALFGCPPEHEWPYVRENLDAEPDAYHYSFAQSFRALTYARIDQGSDREATLDTLKRTLFDGFPVAFGFPVYDSINSIAETNGIVPFPTARDRLLGGHAVLAVGYDNTMEIPGIDQKGAVIFRNSWGSNWAEDGYGYLPYKYVIDALANDFWTIFNREWTDLTEFD